MRTRTTWKGRTTVAPAARPRGRTLALAATALGLAVTVAACDGRGRDRAKAQVDADLGHDLDLASTTGIELANQGGRGTQVVSAIEETPRVATRRAASPKPKSSGHRRHKVAKKEKPDAPPATVMVADHEVMAPASSEHAAGSDSTSNAPSTEGPNAGPAIVPEPEPYPAGGGGDVGSGRGGGGSGVIGVIGVIVRGGMGGVDRCDERVGHGRRGGIGGGIGIPGGGMIPTVPIPGRPTGGWPGRGSTTFPQR